MTCVPLGRLASQVAQLLRVAHRQVVQHVARRKRPRQLRLAQVRYFVRLGDECAQQLHNRRLIKRQVQSVPRSSQRRACGPGP